MATSNASDPLEILERRACAATRPPAGLQATREPRPGIAAPPARVLRSDRSPVYSELGPRSRHACALAPGRH